MADYSQFPFNEYTVDEICDDLRESLRATEDAMKHGELPMLHLVKSHRIRCAKCNAWIIRLPQWNNAELGKSWSCDGCGCTSITIEEARPFGPRSRYWPQLVEEFQQLYCFWNNNDREWFLSTVVVE